MRDDFRGEISHRRRSVFAAGYCGRLLRNKVPWQQHEKRLKVGAGLRQPWVGRKVGAKIEASWQGRCNSAPKRVGSSFRHPARSRSNR
jgi:hypothetical protein